MKNTIAATPNYQVTNEKKCVVKNIVLDGVKTLKAEEITTIFEIKRKIHPKTNLPYRVVDKNLVDKLVKPMSFDLIEVTPEELAVYRKSGISSFVLKVDGKLYYSSIPNNISFVSSNILGVHRCSAAGHECLHLSAASDEDGGCAKVRDSAKCIEKYSWISTGYETFNTEHDSFVVVNCLHYKKCPPHKKLSYTEINKLKIELAQFVTDEDITTIEQVKALIARNKGNIGKH